VKQHYYRFEALKPLKFNEQATNRLTRRHWLLPIQTADFH
jgi:hypothetical protein